LVKPFDKYIDDFAREGGRGSVAIAAQRRRICTVSTDFDVIVIGAGFSGLYALRKLRDELGLRVKVIEKASDVGGTWYWNRYPGALSDSEAFVYCFSDKDLFQGWKWTTRFLTQPQILAYLQYVADRLDLRRDIQFETVVTAARYQEIPNVWEVRTDGGDRITAKYLITALGPLAATNMPVIAGQDEFEGELFHTSAWPADADINGKRVGVIGTGSTGIQLITAIAAEVKHLTVFQRTPQYSIPVGNGPVTTESVDAVLGNSEAHWKGVFDSYAGMGITESLVPTMSVSPEERRAIFQKSWDQGGSFRFALETFSDILIDPEANEAAASFIRERIAEIVKDPVTAAKLRPTGPYSKRPLCDSGYFQVFNRDNVSLIDLRSTPIAGITRNGIRTSDGLEHELDVLIYATGFDALDGNYRRLDIRGRNGESISEHWKDGALSYLGLATSGFPNMFMVQGPNGVFSNAPPAIEIQVNAIVRLVQLARDNDLAALEVKPEAEREWIATCVQIAEGTMLGKGKSWFFGDNIPGKPRQILFYVGGVAAYLQVIRNADAGGFTGFEQRPNDRHSGVARVRAP
jgi:cyclohexanone monooxygenase